MFFEMSMVSTTLYYHAEILNCLCPNICMKTDQQNNGLYK